MLLAFGTIGLIVLFLPVQFQNNTDGLVEYMSGPGIVFADIVIGILSLLPIPFIIGNRENIYQKRLLAYYFNVLLTSIMMFVHIQYPALCLVAFPFTMGVYMIYYRLENPDILFVRKFKKNSERMKEIREKYGFIFNMSPELRHLLNEAASMRDDYFMDPKSVHREQLETLLADFIKGKDGEKSKKPHIDDDGIEILDFEDETPEEMMVTKEIYSLNELQEVLKEDNLPKW